jgi:hypothetical protein
MDSTRQGKRGLIAFLVAAGVLMAHGHGQSEAPISDVQEGKTGRSIA